VKVEHLDLHVKQNVKFCNIKMWYFQDVGALINQATFYEILITYMITYFKLTAAERMTLA
jgi:hypothetical protein